MPGPAWKCMRPGHSVTPATNEGAESTTTHIRRYLEQRAPHDQDKHKDQDPDRRLEFSWFRSLISLASYAFFLSDVLRTGPAVNNLAEYYSVLEPDCVSFFGPYKYVVTHLTTANITAESAGITYWAYKYDSTSLVMRSLARHLLLPAWSPCVLYEESCDETQGLARSSVFTMIDSIIDGLRDYRSKWGGQHLALRVTCEWYDRLQHYALPWFFQERLPRTHQAIYYNATWLQSHPRSFCGREWTRPFSCDSAWTQLYRFSSAITYKHETVWTNIEHRIARLREAYPNKTLELVILDGSDDFSVGGFVSQGTQSFEVVALTRLQDCGPDPSQPNKCVTVAVDDYRQEGGGATSNVTGWFVLIASVRIFGQVYAWSRLGLLVAGCATAQGHDKHHEPQSLLHRCKATWCAVFLVPSQIVVYGSLIPVVCYAFAHLLDSAFVYIRLVYLFVAPLGNLTLTVGEMLLISAVAMRSVWVLASICHLVIAVTTRRSWSPLKLAPGTPRFLIVVVASANIVSAVRLLRLRNSKLVQVDEVVPSERRLLLQSLRHHLTRGHVSSLTVGVRVDARTVSCAILLILAGVALFRVLARTCTHRPGYRASVISHTLVPYSAGSLWPTNTFVVSWRAMGAQQDRPQSPCSGASIMSNDVDMGPRGVDLRPTDSNVGLKIVPRPMPDRLHREISQVSVRGQDGDWKVWMANLVAMTDPVTFLQLRGLRGQLLGLYVVKQTGCRALLPLVWATSHANTELAWDELKLLAVVSTKEVEWAALLRCG